MEVPTGDVPPATRPYRRIPPRWLHHDIENNCVRVSSAAFRDRDTSIYLEDALAVLGREPSEVLDDYPDDYSLVSLTAEEVSSAEQAVQRSPDIKDEMAEDDVGWAHGEFCGPRSKTTRQWLREHARWVVAPPNACPDAAAGTV